MGSFQTLYRRAKKPERKIDANHDWIAEVLKSEMKVPRKQRHSAKNIWDRLREEHNFDGGYTVVKEAVAKLNATAKTLVAFK